MNILPIPALTDNYIWMIETDSQQAWVVDPGESLPVIKTLTRLNLNLAAILLTHHHPDHSGGIAELLKFSGNIPVYGSAQSPIKYINHRLKENDEISCGDICLRVLEIPGHTLDHIAYFNNDILFSGDTLFSVGCGKIFEGTYPQMFESLQKLLNLRDQTLVYCGHEYTRANLQFAEVVDKSNDAIAKKISDVNNILRTTGCTLPSSLGEEKKINPFLRCQTPEIIHAVEQHLISHPEKRAAFIRDPDNKKLNDPIEVFRLLREWKNNFTANK